jgi:Kef-type K+ transport system membrane component KefB/nucleotide-binding universal stress UspA family protein
MGGGLVPSLDEHQLIGFLVALAVVIVLARLLGELARRMGQPEVLGQLVAGVLLGPSVLGMLAPQVRSALFIDPGLALSGVSWLGALLVLMVAGLEVDLGVLRAHLWPGLLAAGFAIVPSLVAGWVFAWLVFESSPGAAAFLGIVLSVTAISVVAALLIERGQTRREFAQVLLAGGITTELCGWVFVAVAAAAQHGSPLLAAGRALALAVGFFVAAVVLGRRLINRAMRMVADTAVSTAAPLSLVIVLTLGFAAVTEALGLHALLGAFVFGVLLFRAPRATPVLRERIRVVTFTVFAPVFFALAGAQVDLRQLINIRALTSVALLLAVATIVKTTLAAVGARLGGFRGLRPLLVGVGLNAKGGSDVVVAILGHQLGLLSGLAYTSYTVVAIITVLFTPTVLRLLEHRSPASGTEQQRLEKEQASARAYTSTLERVLVPETAELYPRLAIDVLENLALSQNRANRPLDITRLTMAVKTTAEGNRGADVRASPVLNSMESVHLFDSELGRGQELLTGIEEAAARHDLTAIGARTPDGQPSLGGLADAVIHRCRSDVLVVVAPPKQLLRRPVRRILVPTNGLPAAAAAADLGGLLAEATAAELILLNVTAPRTAAATPAADRPAPASADHLENLSQLLTRLDIRQRRRVRHGNFPGDEILAEISESGVDLVVLGCTDRGHGTAPYLGDTVERLLNATPVPLILLVVRDCLGYWV